jgi:hypothetical protein
MADPNKPGNAVIRPGAGFGVVPSTTVNPPSAYRAIEIVPGPRACAVAKRFAKHRFLLSEAPTPPLAGCDLQAACTCKFQKYGDRRSDLRRSSDEGIPDFGMVMLERRKLSRRAKIRGNGKR